MLTWAMAWMMVQLDYLVGYLLVASIIGDTLLALLLVSLVHAVVKTLLITGAWLQKDNNGPGPDSM